MGERPGAVAALTPNWLGDVVMALGALRALAAELGRRAPPERLDVWTPRTFAPLLAALLPGADVVGFELGPPGLARLRGRLRTARAMRARDYRSIALLPNSLGSALATWCAGIPERVGVPMHSRGMLLTRKVDRQGPAEHLADAYVRVAEAAAGVRLEPGLRPAPPALPGPVLERARAVLRECGLAEGEPFAAIAPGAAYGPAKRWGEANFAGVARLAGGRGLAAAVIGTKADSGAAAEIARLAEGARVVDVTGRTGLLELAGVLSLADGFVGNDSGAAHLAAALGVPTAVVYLSTDPQRTGQRGAGVRLLVADVECRPCMRRECPRGDYRCREAVRPDQAADALGGAGG